MFPFEKSDLYYPGLANNEIVPVPIPGRLFLQKLNIVGSVGAFNAFLFNRAFTNPTAGIATVTDSSGKAKILFRYPHRFGVGDRIVLAGTTESGYHTTHVVVHMLNALELVTDVDYDADATGGTATLIIPVASVTNLAGFGWVRTETSHVFKVGDTVTIANNSEGDYNASHIVTAVIDAYQFVIDQAHSDDGVGGTVDLAVPSNNRVLYEVVPSTAASSNLVRYEKDYGKPLFNQDRARHHESEYIRLAYFQTSAAGNFNLSIAGQLDQR